MTQLIICRVALAIPLHKQFDYLLPAYLHPEDLNSLIGSRVLVPFGGGHRKQVGVITATPAQSDYAIEKLKSISQLLDQQALLSHSLYKLLNWAAIYYQHPFGDVFQQAIPTLLRKGKPATFKAQEYWKLKQADSDISQLTRAKKQYQAAQLLQVSALSYDQLKENNVSRATLNSLQEKQLVTRYEEIPASNLEWAESLQELQQKPQLSTEQALAITSVTQQLNKFKCYLLEGITGSGKTEVYLNILKAVLEKGQQALIIVPEIGLTPQTIKRFKARFNVPIYLKHSALNEQQQLETWLHAKQGSAAIVIGTRSAIFSDFKNLGLIILDEEHDASFKQQDSFRYHARDFAIKRASQENIPILLGSATPAFESLNNALSGRYQHLFLTHRAGNATPPRNDLINLTGLPLKSGLSPQLIELMQQHLDKNNQVILFLNRRGYAPVLMCHECGWLAKCQRCDAFYTYHKSANYLHCHHCMATHPVPEQCHDCGSTNLHSTGVGTEQLEETLTQLFPDHKTVRIDRDNTRKKDSFNEYLNDINSGKYKILLGTQMLAKGHHFPDVTLVALVDVDGALFSNDFRASERLGQLFTQVAGRAGRAEKKGQVVLQTFHPEHNLLQELVNNGYGDFSRSALQERKMAQLPPFSYQALIRAESLNATQAENFLTLCKQTLNQIAQNNKVSDRLLILGPIAASMERRAGKYRFQLLIQSEQRVLVTKTLNIALAHFEKIPEGRKVRWSIDVDPIDFI
ncbi:primosomal protein N' [Psychromonas sp. SR45-3]|uniref:primosomal protein N' n=1 Tax=Psychromonas sp. SR45-3 TaxID=2760930 RepID=UPI0015F91252|nr:primosomal protein N' [Psychromonas sp. SR45-3]MBB1272289.1 primosomal protein N' [Psychromonas sp. SR45-3]